jgi:hypothetical protein
MKRRLRAPSPALVISVIALFVALGGTTYAATSLPKNSVGTKQLKAGAVTKSKISNNTLIALKGNQGPPGPKGSTGQQGVKGDTGSQGVPGTARAYAVVTPVGAILVSHNVVSVTSLGSGMYCVELASSIPHASTIAVVSPDYAQDGTTNTEFAHVEFSGPCGTNGMFVRTFQVTQGTASLQVAFANEGFSIAVP